MSTRAKPRPPWQSVGTGARDIGSRFSRPAWQGADSGPSRSTGSRSPVKARIPVKTTRSPTRAVKDYKRSQTLHAYGSDTVSSSVDTANTSVLTSSSIQSLDDSPPTTVTKAPVRTGRPKINVAPPTCAEDSSAPRKPTVRTPAPQKPPSLSNSRAASRSSAPVCTPKRRGSSRQASRQSSVKTKDKDGWEADSEDSFTVVGVEPKPCVWIGKASPDRDDGIIPVLQPPLTTRGAAFAALSDASSSCSLSSPRAGVIPDSDLDADDAPGLTVNRSDGDYKTLSTTVTSIQKDLASLRDSLSGPRISSNPLVSPHSTPAMSAPLPPSNIMTGASMSSTASRRRQLPGRSGSDRARKVPLPPELTTAGLDKHGRNGRNSGDPSPDPPAGMSGLIAGGGIVGDLAPIATESSFGLSCGLPGLSHEVSETITHLTAAEVIQESVTVTALSLRDWLLRPTPTPFDPSLTLYGAAVHNAHVAGCEVLIGGMLTGIEEGTIERPKGLPSGSCEVAFRKRGISDTEAARTVFRSIAGWIGEISDRADRCRAPVMQDPRALPLLTVLRYEALHRIGESMEDSGPEAGESARLHARNRSEHLNATDMLYVLISALFPAFRHLISRNPDTSPIASPHHSTLPQPSPFDGKHEDPDEPNAMTALSTGSLFSVATEALQDDNVGSEYGRAAGAGESEGQVGDGGVNHAGRGLSLMPAESGPFAVGGEEALGLEGSLVESLPSFAAGFGLGGFERRDSLGSVSCATADSGRYGAAGHCRSGSGGISQAALTDALQRLLGLGDSGHRCAPDGEDGKEGGLAADPGEDGPAQEVDVIAVLRQIASERIQAKRAGTAVDAASMFLADGQPVTDEARSAQALEVDKLLQKPEVIRVLTQLASNAAVDLSGQHIQAAISKSETAKAIAATARDRSKVLAADMARQRFIINTFANMNMMQQQMNSHMFGSLLKAQGPSPGATEVNAMIRSMAKRQGYQGLVKPLNAPGKSMMNGAIDSAMPFNGASLMPVHPPAQQPMSAFGTVSMPYLAMAGGAVPVPNSVKGGGTSFSMGLSRTGSRAPHATSSMLGGTASSAMGAGVYGASMQSSMGAMLGGPGAGGSVNSNRSTSGSTGRSQGRSGSTSKPPKPRVERRPGRSNSTTLPGAAMRGPPPAMPLMPPPGAAFSYMAADGTRLPLPSSNGSDHLPSGIGTGYMHSGSLTRTSSLNPPTMQSPSQVHAQVSRGPKASARGKLQRPTSAPVGAFPPMRAPHSSSFGNPEPSRSLSKQRSLPRMFAVPPEAPPAAATAKPHKHSRSKSFQGNKGGHRDIVAPSSGRTAERTVEHRTHEAATKETPTPRGRSSRVMAAVNAARRTLSSTRRRSSSRRSKSPNKPTPCPPNPPDPAPPTSGSSQRSLKPPPTPPNVHNTPGSKTQQLQRPHSAHAVYSNGLMRSTTSSSGPSAMNSSFMFDSNSSGTSMQFDSLTSTPTTGSNTSGPQQPATPPQASRRPPVSIPPNGGQPGGPLVGGLVQRTAPTPYVQHPPVNMSPMQPPPQQPKQVAAAATQQQPLPGAGYGTLLSPQQIMPGGVARRGAARRMMPQLAATPEVEEDEMSFLDATSGHLL